MATGIVCEFNPFHNGHAYLLRRAKELGSKDIVCAMSGNFVQRGERSCADKYLRAKWAVIHGADIVLENPFPFSCATAERFALGAINTLFSSGLCDTVAFGVESENARETDFYEAARILSDKKCKTAIEKLVKERKTLGYAEARSIYIRENYGSAAEELICAPNNLLGVEYAKAALSLGARPTLLPIPRLGAKHDKSPDNGSPFASASVIRADASGAQAKEYCPADVAEAIKNIGFSTTDSEKYYAALCTRIMYADTEYLISMAEVPREYAQKLKKAVAECTCFEDFFATIKARHMTEAKLRRMLLYILTETKKEDLTVLPRSSLLLAVSDNGAAMLKKRRKKEHDFVILSKIADIKKLPADEKKLYEAMFRAEKLFDRLR